MTDLFLVDDREPAYIQNSLRTHGADVTRLEVGDVLVNGYVVERKEASDFVNSLWDGRLFDQAARMMEGGDRPILILEGDLRHAMIYTKAPPWKLTRSLNGAMSKLAAMGVSVIPTIDKKNTISFLKSLSEHSAQDLTVMEKPAVTYKRFSSYENGLMQVEGIGKKRAQKLAEDVPSLAALCELPYYELYDKLGEKTSEKMWEFLHNEEIPSVYQALGTGSKAQKLVKAFPQVEEGVPVKADDVSSLDGLGPSYVSKLADVGLVEL